jgi:hypothetical protein
MPTAVHIFPVNFAPSTGLTLLLERHHSRVRFYDAAARIAPAPAEAKSMYFHERSSGQQAVCGPDEKVLDAEKSSTLDVRAVMKKRSMWELARSPGCGNAALLERRRRDADDRAAVGAHWIHIHHVASLEAWQRLDQASSRRSAAAPPSAAVCRALFRSAGFMHSAHSRARSCYGKLRSHRRLRYKQKTRKI